MVKKSANLCRWGFSQGSACFPRVKLFSAQVTTNSLRRTKFISRLTGLHGTATVAMAYLILDLWDCGLYWYLLFSLTPAQTLDIIQTSPSPPIQTMYCMQKSKLPFSGGFLPSAAAFQPQLNSSSWSGCSGSRNPCRSFQKEGPQTLVQIFKEVCCDACFVGQSVNIPQEPKLETLDFCFGAMAFPVRLLCIGSLLSNFACDITGGKRKEC